MLEPFCHVTVKDPIYGEPIAVVDLVHLPKQLLPTRLLPRGGRGVLHLALVVPHEPDQVVRGGHLLLTLPSCPGKGRAANDQTPIAYFLCKILRQFQDNFVYIVCWYS